MKRLFTYISMLALAVACEDMYGPVQTPIDPDKPGEIAITVDEVLDNAVTFTVTPASESAYYSYMVQAGDEAVEVDAKTLYADGYKKDAAASGTIKWTEEKKSATITVSKLASNTTYQIYAVAGSPMGIVGTPANTSFKTSDTVAPVMKSDYESEDNVITFTFDEPVVRGTGALTAKVYAMNSVEIETGTALATLPVKEENITVEGNSVTVTVEGLPAGAFYSVDYPAGAFKDVCGNEAAAVESAVFFGEDTEYEPEYVGLGGRNATKDWGFEDLPEGLTDWTAPIALTPDSPYGLGYIYGDAITLIYMEGTSKMTAFELEYKSGYGLLPSGQLVALLPEEPAGGASVIISVPAEAFEDYYGNLNAEWEGVTKSPYDMTVPFENVVGTYVMTQTSAFDVQKYQSLMTLEKSDNPVKGNVMMTTYETFECVAPIYGCYNPEAMTLTFASQQIFTIVDDQGTKLAFMFVSGALNGNTPVVGSEPVVFQLNDDGLIIGCDYYYGVYLLDATTGSGIGWYDFYYLCSTSPYVPEASAESADALPMKSYPLDAVVLR